MRYEDERRNHLKSAGGCLKDLDHLTFLILAGLAGYCSGLVLVFINSGQLLVYPLHLTVGSLIALFLVIQYVITRKIKGMESSWRTPHLAAGIFMLCLYALQIITGLALLA